MSTTAPTAPTAPRVDVSANRWNAVWLFAAAAGATAGVLGWRAPETRSAAAPSEGGSWLPHRLGLLPGLVLGLGLFGMGGFIAFVALYAIDIGLDGAGPLFALFAVVVVAVRRLGAKIPDRLGAARTVRIALNALAAGLATMGLWQEPVGLYVGTFVFSVGQALAFPSLPSLVLPAQVGRRSCRSPAPISVGARVGATSRASRPSRTTRMAQPCASRTAARVQMPPAGFEPALRP